MHGAQLQLDLQLPLITSFALLLCFADELCRLLGRLKTNYQLSELVRGMVSTAMSLRLLGCILICVRPGFDMGAQSNFYIPTSSRGH